MRRSEQGRSLPWPGFVVVVVYVAIIQVVGLLAGLDTGESDSQFPTTESIVFAVAVTSWLGWWGGIVRHSRPVRRWVRFVPMRVGGVIWLPMLVHGSAGWRRRRLCGVLPAP